MILKGTWNQNRIDFTGPMKHIIPFIGVIAICLIQGYSGLAQIQNTRKVPYKWNTDTSKRNIVLSELISVLPRHSFPTINYPDFLEKESGLASFYQYEPVIAVSINGESKAYPMNMLTMHEMSNDSLGGIPILPTYCPLCNSSVVYDRRLTYKGKEYVFEFEVSGMLRNSDMVMADKQTETWWQQLTGKGLVGELSGVELKVIPSMVISVREFFERYPDGKILSPKNGTSSEEQYGTNPYESYDNQLNKPYSRYYDYSKLDKRLPAMERVIDLEGKNGYKIYPYSAIAQKGVINDSYDDKNIVIFYKPGLISILDQKDISKSKAVGSVTMFSSEVDGSVLTFKKEKEVFVDQETGSSWDITGRCISGKLKGKELTPERYSNHFAFAWLTFYPESEIYEQ
ncbi:MAG: hypothetical protein CL840_18310 [Crocinitomicaceae bacterium]|nr:hypothetical protein [Crocinitomicaceae bacterium]|tara:strand:+ start:4633 stop:5829 length:1197 start_codon:yes stop_codon:yes gene_type:complete